MIFPKEIVQQSSTPLDRGKLAEIPSHQLLKIENSTNESIASFDQVITLGKLLLDRWKAYNHDLVDPSLKDLNSALLAHFVRSGESHFWGILQLPGSSEQRFPVTAEIVDTPQGKNIILYIVPVSLSVFENQQFQHSTDSMLALAAATLTAPHFLLALKGGITTNTCSSKKPQVTAITPDHGAPLAVTFDAFAHSTQTLKTVAQIAGNNQINIQQAAHLHGKSTHDAISITSASSRSKISAGIPLHQILMTQIPNGSRLLIAISQDSQGKTYMLSTSQFLQSGVNTWNATPDTQKDALILESISDLSLIAATLGFTAEVVGDDKREKLIEKIIDPESATTPLRDIIS